MEALVLTADKAEALGLVGAGPFTFAGAFPGEFLIGEPVAVGFFGFDNDEAAHAAFDDAFAELHPDDVPLEWTTVDEGEGLPVRVNHALSEFEAVEEAAQETVDEVRAIRSHADADEVADELGITFPEGAKLDEKRDAIAAVRAGVPAGDPDGLTPAPGAEDTTPHPDGGEEPPA